MKVGLVGYQGSGKSCTFELLTGIKPDPSLTHKGQLGVAVVPDARFDGLVKFFNPKKISPSKIELLDTPGLSRDEGDSNGGKMAVVREAHVLIHVIGSFNGADAVADAVRFEEDIMLADQQVLQNRLERLKVSIAKNRPDKKECQEELTLIEPIAKALDEGKFLRDVELSEDQDKATRSFSLLTRKQLLIVLNTADAGVDEQAVKALQEKGYQVVSAPIGLELEVAGLDPADRDVFAEEMGLGEPCRTRLLRAIFEVTDQITFYTSDEKEVRAWLLKRGSTALEAAGTIHTDLARGFIRAEIIAVDDLLRLGSEREVKAQNLHILAGKEHVVRDGDELVIRFSV